MTFHMSCVTCHLSHVTCRMSHVICHMLCVLGHMSLTRSPNLSTNKKNYIRGTNTKTHKHKAKQTDIATYRLNSPTISFPKIRYMDQISKDGGK